MKIQYKISIYFTLTKWTISKNWDDAIPFRLWFIEKLVLSKLFVYWPTLNREKNFLDIKIRSEI